MAVCSPYPSARFPERMDEVDEGGWIAMALKRINGLGGEYGLEVRNTKEQMERYRKTLEQILPLSWDDLTSYYIRRGWLRVDRAASKKAGHDVIEVGFRGDWVAQTKQVREALAVTKTYFESVGGGTQAKAQELITKVNVGEDALDAARTFAAQMQHVTRFGQFVLQLDQQAGRLLQMQQLRKDPNLLMRLTAKQALNRADIEAATFEATEDFLSAIARQMGSGDEQQMKDAIGELLKLAKRVQFAGNPVEALKITRSLHLAGGVFNELWYNGLLSSPETISTNALGFTWGIARPLSQYLTASLANAVGLPGARQASEEAGAALSNMWLALRDASKLAWKAAKQDNSLYGMTVGRSELVRDAGITGKAFGDVAQQKFGVDLPDNIIDIINMVGHAVRLPSKALLAGDEFTKHLVLRGEVAKKAIKRAYAQGIDLSDPVAYQKAISDEMGLAFKSISNPDIREAYQLNAAYEYAASIRDEALYATFQQNNDLANAFQQFFKIPIVGPMMRPFFPFVRTPLNILKEGFVDSTPIGLLVKARQLWVNTDGSDALMKRILDSIDAAKRNFKEDPGAAYQVAGQMGLTTTIAGWLYMETMSGNATGGGPGRWHPDKTNKWKYQDAWQKAMEEQGKTPYTIYGIPFARFGEPIAIVLRMVTDLAEYSSHISKEEQDGMFYVISSIMIPGLYQASFLQGLNNLMEAMGEGDNSGRAFINASQGYLSTFTPFGGLLNYLRTIDDPYKTAWNRATWDDLEADWGVMLGRLRDRIPGLGNAPVLHDQVTGKPIMQRPGSGEQGLNPLQLAIPIWPRGNKSDDTLWQDILKFRGFYAEYTPSDVDLTRQEQQVFNQIMAKVEIGGLKFQDWVRQFLKRSDVQKYMSNKPPTGIEAERFKVRLHMEFDNMRRRYGQVALVEMQKQSPNLQQRDALKALIKDAARRNDPQSGGALLEDLSKLETQARQEPINFVIP